MLLYTRRLLLPALLALASCGGGGSAYSACTIELNGDSIMAGVQINTFASSISKLRPEYKIVDKAVVGLSLKSVHDGYINVWVGGPVSPLGPQPAFKNITRTSKVVLVELGGNDGYENINPEDFRTKFEDIVQTIISEGRVPVITGIAPLILVPGSAFDQTVLDNITVLDSIVHEIAAKYSILDAQWRTVPFAGASDTVDGIHRTQIAADKLAARTVEVLDQACAK